MPNYTQIYYHLVFTTKDRKPTLDKANRKDLYRYMWGVLNKKKCHLYQIGGTDNHIHIFSDLHPTLALSELIKTLKLASSTFIKSEKLFPKFSGWQDNYSAFTLTHEGKENLIAYIKNQEAHHATVSFKDELKGFLERHGVKYEDKYLD